MDHDDEQLRHTFDRLRFDAEPPMASTSADDLHRAERHLRRRRAAVLGSGVTGLAAVAISAALALPAVSGSGSSPSDVGAAGSGDGVRTGQGGTVKSEQGAEPNGDDVRLPFPQTRQLLLDTAVEHFDPERSHLPGRSTNAPHGGSVHDGRLEGNIDVGTKLGWTIPGESGEGLVSVHVTTPGYASWEKYALEGFASDLGCDIGSGSCTQVTIPGTDQRAWVAEGDPVQSLEFSVVYERSDGSLVGVGVYDHFGQNSAEPVSGVDITRDDAYAFVTDPDLQFDPAEATEGLDLDAGDSDGLDWN